MSLATMAKKKNPKNSDPGDPSDTKDTKATELTPEGEPDAKEPITSLKCYIPERDLVGRAAGSRGKSVAEFLRMKDVRRFFHHVIIAAGQQAEKDLKEEEQKPT